MIQDAPVPAGTEADVPLEALSELAGSVARAIGGPLTAIGMAVDRLRSHGSPCCDNEAELQIILEQTHRMGYLAETLRALAQPVRARPRPVELNALIREVTGVTRTALDREGIRVETTLRRDLPVASGDPHQIREVLLSLLYNARLALEDWDGPRTVVVDTREAEDGYVEARITDSGPGISQGEEERIFLPFVSGWGREGVGLSISRLALLGQGGQLRVETGCCPGACFTIRLPPLLNDGAKEETDA